MGQKIKHCLNILFLLLGLYLLSACSGGLSAKVFLDKNGDSLKGEKELIIENLPVTLYRDGVQVETLSTDSEGTVNFLIQQKGKYCVRLDEADITQINSSNLIMPESDLPKALAAKIIAPAATPDATATPKPSPAAQDQTSSQPKNTVKPYEACTETKGPTSVSLEVPVPVDYAKTITSIPDFLVQSVSPGDEVELIIDFPKQCELKLMTLPAELVYPVTTGELVHEMAWNDVIALGTKPIVDTAPINVNRDTLREFPIKVKVADNIGDLEAVKRIQITPQVTCPGGLDLDLKTHILEIGKQTMFEIYHDREGETVAGGEVTIITHVINNTNQSFSASDVRLTFSGPLYGDPTFDARCGGSHCSFALEPKQQVDLQTKIKIPDHLKENTSFQLSAVLKVKLDGQDQVFQEETPAQFGVLPNI